MHLRSSLYSAFRAAALTCLAASFPVASASAQTSSTQTSSTQTSSTQTSPAAILQPPAQHDRVAAHPDFTPITQLSHQLPGWAQAGRQSPTRSIDLSTTIKLSFVLRRDPAVQTAFEQFLAAQQTPGSPHYHQWLTPQQVGQLFGPTQDDLAALTTWVTSQGLKVDSVAPNGVLVHASGTTAVVGNALHTSFASFTTDDFAGATHVSAVSEPSIPSALIPLIGSIQGLSEVPLQPMVRGAIVKGAAGSNPLGIPGGPRPQFTNTSGSTSTYYLTPGDFAVVYDINGIYTAGNKGATIGSKAQHIAVIGESRVADTDITEYESITSLPSVIPTVVIPTGAVDPGTTNTNAQDEATLDVDRVIGTAPGAAVDLVVAKDTTTTSGIFEGIEYNVDTFLDPVMTISFGACESTAGQSNVNFIDTLASTGAAEGITTLVSSGDSGVAGCDTSFQEAPATQIASINFLCSSSYVTCVGGTEFNDTANPSAYWSATNGTGLVSALTYIPEGVWNEPSSVSNGVTSYAPGASGGGVSTFIAKPTWQTGTGVPADGFRDVPDVSFPAASHDGYFACLAYAGGDCSKNFFDDFSGTSAAAPGMAGVVALVNTQLGSAQGNINPLLYRVAASTPAAFHDATIASSGVTNCTSATPSTCNNSTPGPTTLTGGLAGFDLTTGYDLATGLGSLDVGAFITGATSSSGSTGSFTLAVAPTTLSVTPISSSDGTPDTGTATSTITVTSTGTFAGAVALSCAVTPATALPPSCAVSPSSATLTANGTATSNLTITYVGPTSNCSTNVHSAPIPIHGAYLGPAALVLLLLFLPFRKRKSVQSLACVVLLVTGLAALGGCGGNSNSGSPVCSEVIRSGTTAGSYTVTVTGTSGSQSATASVALTVNASN